MFYALFEFFLRPFLRREKFIFCLFVQSITFAYFFTVSKKFHTSIAHKTSFVYLNCVHIPNIFKHIYLCHKNEFCFLYFLPYCFWLKKCADLLTELFQIIHRVLWIFPLFCENKKEGNPENSH